MTENGVKMKKPKDQKVEEKDPKEQKLDAVVDMMMAFGTAAAICTQSHKRTEALFKAMNKSKDLLGTPLETSTMKIAMDITGTKASQTIAYEAIAALDVQLKSMRMNIWKKVIAGIRGQLFDVLHADTLLLDKLSLEFGRDL